MQKAFDLKRDRKSVYEYVRDKQNVRDKVVPV